MECFGTKQADTLNGSEGSDLMYGKGRGDTPNGFGSPDYLYGQGGADKLFGSPGADYWSGISSMPSVSSGQPFTVGPFLPR